jgi:hypothetical protein
VVDGVEEDHLENVVVLGLVEQLVLEQHGLDGPGFGE